MPGVSNPIVEKMNALLAANSAAQLSGISRSLGSEVASVRIDHELAAKYACVFASYIKISVTQMPAMTRMVSSFRSAEDVSRMIMPFFEEASKFDPIAASWEIAVDWEANSETGKSHQFAMARGMGLVARFLTAEMVIVE